jgi:hypothetical protein
MRSREEYLLELWFAIQQYHKRAKAIDFEQELRSQPKASEYYSRYEQWMSSQAVQLDKSGLLAAGFAFRDPVSRRPVFFEQGSALHSHASRFQTPYVVSEEAETDERKLGKLRSILHHAFLQTRDQQFRRFQDEGSGAPEFARLTGEGRPSVLSSSSGKLFSQLGALYVNPNEVALCIYAWLRLVAGSASASDVPARELLGENVPPFGGRPFQWMSIVFNPDETNADEFRKLIEQWEQILSTNDRSKAWMERLVWSGESGEVEVGADILAISGWENLNKTALSYVLRLTGADESTSAAELLRDFENVAPVPIFPYFIWALIDAQPRGHLVAPIWTTISGPILDRLDGSEASQSTVGWAVASVRPFRISEGTSDALWSRTLGLTLAVLQAFARPAVDLVYYSRERSDVQHSRLVQFVSSIMSRNVSHNIGSHVIHNVVHRRDFALSAPVGSLLSYLQERMDYIALISSPSASSWEVVDSLADVLTPFVDSESLLLQNIVRSQRNLPPRILYESRVEAEDDDLLAVPFGIVGRHSLYAIFENVIRNAAKYGNENRDRELILTVRISNSLDEETQKPRLTLEIIDNNRSSTGVVERLNDIMTQSIFDPADPLASTINWGIKEIKISAAFLSGHFDKLFDPTSIDIPKPLWFLDGDRGDGRRSLGLRIWLQRPLGMLIVSSNPRLRRGTLARDRLTDFAHPADLTTGRRQHYELVIVDGSDLYDKKFETQLLRIVAFSRRVAVVGSKTPVEVETHGACRIADTWEELLSQLEFRREPAPFVSQLCLLWALKRWPDGRIVLITDAADRFPELGSIADKILVDPVKVQGKRLIDSVGTRLRLSLKNTAIFDHCDYDFKPGEAEGNRIFSVLGTAAYHQPIRAPLTFSYGDTELKWRLREAAFLRIGVVDERVWEKRDDEFGDVYKKAPLKSGRFGDIWRRLGVDVIDPDVMEQTAGAAGPTRRTLLSGRRYDFLIIHRGLIDQWSHRLVSAESEGDTALQMIETDFGPNNLIYNLLGFARTVVLVSGRGPEVRRYSGEVQFRVRQIDFAALREAMLVGLPNKVKLTKLLTSL